VAHQSEKKAKMTWANVVALTNNEIRLVFAYDASGNMINREAILPTPKGGNGNDSTKLADIDSAETFFGGSGMTKSAGAGTGKSGGSSVAFQSVDVEQPEMKVDIYPNPTQGMLQVDISNVDIPSGAQIEIYSASGLLAGRWTGISPNNIYDITDKPAGIYILRLTIDKDNAKSWRIVKN